MELKFWNGDKGRKLAVRTPCECGCDTRGGVKMAGYITGSNAKGDGFTLTLDRPEDVAKLGKLFAAMDLERE